MNPNALAIMWFLTLVTVGLLWSGNQYWWVPVVVSGFYTVYAILPVSRRR